MSRPIAPARRSDGFRFIVLLIVMTTAIAAGRAAWIHWRPPEIGVPTTRVQRGRVDTSVHATGELKSTRSTTLTAPAVGGQLRLLTLKATGTAVSAGDVVMTFDPSAQENTLEEQRALLREADMELAQRDAEAAVLVAQDKVSLLTTNFDIRKAELDIRGNELLSAIKARQNELTLEEARRQRTQIEEDVRSHATTSQAAMAVAREKRIKAQLAMDQAQRAIASMIVRAPIDGVIAVSANRDGVNFFFNGMTLPEYREGDTVSSGREVIEVLDVRQIEFIARVEETDRARVAEGQRATLTFDGLSARILDRMPHAATANGGGTPRAPSGDVPSATLTAAASVGLDGMSAATIGARVTAVGTIRNPRAFFSPAQGPVRLLDVSLTLDRPMPIARPGLTARVRIDSDPLTNVLYVPRQAVFDRDGTPTVFVKRSGTGDRFDPRPVTIVTRTESVVVISNLAEGTEIALIDPDRDPDQATPAGTPADSVPTTVVAASSPS